MQTLHEGPNTEPCTPWLDLEQDPYQGLALQENTCGEKGMIDNQV